MKTKNKILTSIIIGSLLTTSVVAPVLVISTSKSINHDAEMYEFSSDSFKTISTNSENGLTVTNETSLGVETPIATIHLSNELEETQYLDIDYDQYFSLEKSTSDDLAYNVYYYGKELPKQKDNFFKNLSVSIVDTKNNGETFSKTLIPLTVLNETTKFLTINSKALGTIDPNAENQQLISYTINSSDADYVFSVDFQPVYSPFCTIPDDLSASINNDIYFEVKDTSNNLQQTSFQIFYKNSIKNTASIDWTKYQDLTIKFALTATNTSTKETTTEEYSFVFNVTPPQANTSDKFIGNPKNTQKNRIRDTFGAGTTSGWLSFQVDYLARLDDGHLDESILDHVSDPDKDYDTFHISDVQFHIYNLNSDYNYNLDADWGWASLFYTMGWNWGVDGDCTPEPESETKYRYDEVAFGNYDSKKWYKTQKISQDADQPNTCSFIFNIIQIHEPENVALTTDVAKNYTTERSLSNVWRKGHTYSAELRVKYSYKGLSYIATGRYNIEYNQT